MSLYWMVAQTCSLFSPGKALGKKVGLWTILWLMITSSMDGSVSRIDLQQAYREEVTEKDVNDRQPHKSTRLEMILWQFLYTIYPTTKMGDKTIKLIGRSVENIPDWRPMQAAQAFRHIEQFALNLLDYPWRKEFKTIKLYTGFWKLKIEKHLYEVITLFDKMGYKKQGDAYLTLQDTASRQQLIEVAVDCYIAAAELQFYEEIHLLIDHQGFSLADVHTCRTSIAGDKQACIDWISSNCKPSFKKIQETFEKANSDLGDNNHVGGGKGGRRLSSRRDSDLSGASGPLPPAPSTSVSIDNVSEPSEEHDPRDSGYQSKPNTREHPKVKSSSEGVDARNNGSKSFSSGKKTLSESVGSQPYAMEAAAFAAVENDYVDPIEPPPPPRNSSMDEDFFAPKTMEDHMKQSLKLVSQKSEKEGGPSGGPSFNQDWGLVTNHLVEKYGEEYFAGQRGDFLKDGSSKDTGYLSEGLRQSNAAASSSMVAGKLAGIHKGAGRKGSPQSPSTPMAMQSCAMQYNQSNSSTMKGLYNQSSLEADGSQSPEILQPPKSNQFLLDTGYQAPNFTTFGVEHQPQRPSNRTDINTNNISSSNNRQSPYDNLLTRGISHDYKPDMFGLDSTGVERSGGVESLTRTWYKADSQQSLDKDNFMPIATNVPAASNASAMPTSSMSAPAGQRPPEDPFAVYAQPNKPAGGRKANKTEPILRKKGPAPAVPLRRHTLPPNQGGAGWSCSKCTYTNVSDATVCKLCGKSKYEGAEQRGQEVGGSQCTQCTLINKPGALMCSACNNPLAKSPTYI